MPNRFTIKDALFLLIGLVVCLLLLLNMVKTNREAEALAGIEEALQQQTATLQELHDAIADPTDGAGVLFRDTISEFHDQQWQTAPDAQLPADFSPGGTIIHIRNAEPATLTPFVARDSYANDIHGDIFEKLCWRNLDPPFQYVPGLLVHGR